MGANIVVVGVGAELAEPRLCLESTVFSFTVFANWFIAERDHGQVSSNPF